MRNSTWSDLELTRSRPGTDLESTWSRPGVKPEPIWSRPEPTRSIPGADPLHTRGRSGADPEPPFFFFSVEGKSFRDPPAFVLQRGECENPPHGYEALLAKTPLLSFFTVSVTTTVLSKDISSWRAVCDVGISLFLLFGCLYLHNFFYSFADFHPLSFHILPSEVVCRELFP
jgi:hypothetical protein